MLKLVKIVCCTYNDYSTVSVLPGPLSGRICSILARSEPCVNSIKYNNQNICYFLLGTTVLYEPWPLHICEAS